MLYQGAEDRVHPGTTAHLPSVLVLKESRATCFMC